MFVASTHDPPFTQGLETHALLETTKKEKKRKREEWFVSFISSFQTVSAGLLFSFIFPSIIQNINTLRDLTLC